MKSTNALALAAALAGAAVPTAGHAQTAVNLMDPSPRAVQTRTLVQTLDDAGRLVAGEFGPPVTTALTADAGRLRATVSAADAMEASMPPAIPPMTLGGVTATFTDGRIDAPTDVVTALDPATGAARTSRMSSGVVALNLDAGGLSILLPLRFSAVELGATDMGPLFLAEAVTSTTVGVIRVDQPIAVPGGGAACAMAGSPFLAIPELAIPDCNATTPDGRDAFVNEVRVDPAAFDPATGEIREVGVVVIRIAPLRTAAGVVQIAPIVRFKFDGVQRLTEG
jgi:hypothetical protein